MNPETTSSARGPIWFGIALIVIVAGIGGWIYFLQPNQSALNVNMTLSTNPANVLVGDPFDLSVALSNDSGSALQNASVSLVLPIGVISASAPNQRVITQQLGNVNAGGVSHEDFQLVATGGMNTVLHFTANVTYAAAGSSAQFKSSGGLDVAIGQSAVGVDLSVPLQVFSGQNFPVVLTYNNTTNQAISGVSVAMQYPSAFMTNASSSWNLASIPANSSGTITINGNLVGPNGASYPIGATVSETVGGQSETIANPIENVSLAASPLTFSIAVNGSQSYVSHTGDSLNYLLTFTNNSQIAFQNIIIAAKLAGSMFDFSTLSSNGSFNSIANTITWNGANAPQLLSLAPGQSGSVNFFIRTKSAFPIRLLSDKNYALSVGAKLQSPTVPAGTDANSTISVANITTKLGGQIVLASRAYHHEPLAGVGGSLGPSGIANAGPYPPVANKATQYTIHWLITNYATDADNVTISAYLQSGTTCTGKIVVPASTTLACNPSSGQVTWKIPVVAATTGIADKPLEAVFQVTNTPAVNQVGATLTLLGAATLTATDGFTSSTLQASAQSITTALPDDTSVSANQRGVQQ